MAKNRRVSGSSGLVTVSYTKRLGRNAMSGQFGEVTKTRTPHTMPLEITAPDGTMAKNVRGDRVVRKLADSTMVEAVMRSAANEGLTEAKDGRIAGRVSSELIAKAKARTGITSDTELLEFALANVAIEDRFAEAFHAVRGSIDADIDFGF